MCLERWEDKATKCNILISPLEGEKKFLSELCELRNFREGYKKYKKSDRATECAIVCVGDKKGKIKMNKNNLQPKQPSNLAILSPAASAVYISLLGKYAQPTFETNYSPLTIHHSLKRKVAFTLAEVLITLGIIGVVAALTLPNLIANYKKQVTVSKLKQSYTTIAQAFKMAEAENGKLSDLYEFKPASPTETVNKQEFLTNLVQNYILPYLKTPNDYGFSNMHSQFGYTGTTWTSYFFMLSNGALVQTDFISTCLRKEDGVCVEPAYGNIMLIIDINGLNPPNEAGKDIFYTELLSNGEYRMLRYVDGRQVALNGCASSQQTCGYLIQLDGWTIASDYPWRL